MWILHDGSIYLISFLNSHGRHFEIICKHKVNQNRWISHEKFFLYDLLEDSSLMVLLGLRCSQIEIPPPMNTMRLQQKHWLHIFKKITLQLWIYSMTNSQNSHRFWLSEKEIEFIRSTFSRIPSVSRVRIFGSRAKGNWTPRSDIDIAYDGDISHGDYSEIWSRLTYDAPFLYKCDIIDVRNAPKDLKEHIDRVGVEI